MESDDAEIYRQPLHKVNSESQAARQSSQSERTAQEAGLPEGQEEKPRIHIPLRLWKEQIALQEVEQDL